jgi:hypothetical protein
MLKRKKKSGRRLFSPEATFFVTFGKDLALDLPGKRMEAILEGDTGHGKISNKHHSEVLSGNHGKDWEGSGGLITLTSVAAVILGAVHGDVGILH